MKNTLDGIISRPEMTEGKTEKLKTEIQAIQRGIFFNEKSFSELWDNFSWYDIVGVPKELKRKKGQKKIFEEIMARSFPNLMKTVNSGIQESQQTPSKHQNLPRYSIIEWIKISDKREGLSSNMKKLSGVMDANTFIFLNVVVVLQLCNYV